MKGHDIYNRALILLGYSGETANRLNEDALAERGKELINQLLCDFGASHPFLIKGERLISLFHLHRHHYPSSFSVPVSTRAVVLFRRKSADPL